MSPNTILLLQSLGVTLQMINASIASVIRNPVMALLFGAAVGGFQFYLQHVGNKTNPNPDAEALKKSAAGGV